MIRRTRNFKSLMIVYDVIKEKNFTEKPRICIACHGHLSDKHRALCYEDIVNNIKEYTNILKEAPLVGRLGVGNKTLGLKHTMHNIKPNCTVYTEPCFKITSMILAEAYGDQSIYFYGYVEDSKLGTQLYSFLNSSMSYTLDIEVERVINKPYKYELKNARLMPI